MTLTEPQARALAYLRDHPRCTSREVAWHLWPDSPAWGKRTRKFRGQQGAVGGTMPMLGGRLLWRLLDLGFASRDRTPSGVPLWEPSISGLRALRAWEDAQSTR